MKLRLPSMIVALVLGSAGCKTPQGEGEAPREPLPAAQPSAEKRAEHLRAHKGIAGQLEKYEGQACQGVDAKSRALCPLVGNVEAVDEIPGGVRLTIIPGLKVTPVVQQIRCHMGFAESLSPGSDLPGLCPLYLMSIEVDLEGRHIDLVSQDKKTESAIRKEAEDLIPKTTPAPEEKTPDTAPSP